MSEWRMLNPRGHTSTFLDESSLGEAPKGFLSSATRRISHLSYLVYDDFKLFWLKFLFDKLKFAYLTCLSI